MSKKFPKLKKKDNKKKFSRNKELLISKNFKRKKLHKNSKPKRWSKNSLQLRPSKKLKLPQQKKQLPKQILPD